MKVDLGSGPDRRPGFVTVDVNAGYEPDVLWDLNKLPYPFEAESVEQIVCTQVYEHLSIHSIDFFREIARILRSDGTLDLIYPNMFSLPNRIRFLFGRIDSSPEWNPHHTKLVHPNYVLNLLRHLGFAPRLVSRRLPPNPFTHLIVGSVHIVARKRR